MLNEERISELWNNFKHPNIDVIRVPKEETQGQKKYLTITGNVFSNIMKPNKAHTEET